MNAEIKIPKDWRRLRRNEVIKKGDRYLLTLYWEPFVHCIGMKLTESGESFAIRRIKSK